MRWQVALSEGRPGDETVPEPPAAASGTRPVYSIGAVARMLGIEVGTIRAWEERYKVVIPARSPGSQRLFSRDEVDQLRFVLRCIDEGSSPADAHRLLRDQLGSSLEASAGGTDTLLLILLTERDRYAAELAEYFLRTEGYGVSLATSSAEAKNMFAAGPPNLSIVEVAIAGGLELCRHLARDQASPVLALSSLDIADEALAAGASAFLRKPLEQLQFVSTVRDLLGSSALTRRARVPVS